MSFWVARGFLKLPMSLCPKPIGLVSCMGTQTLQMSFRTLRQVEGHSVTEESQQRDAV